MSVDQLRLTKILAIQSHRHRFSRMCGQLSAPNAMDDLELPLSQSNLFPADRHFR